jgi:hypothetical protein
MKEAGFIQESIGCYVAESIKPVYCEIEGLLGIRFAWNDFSAKVLLVDGIDLSSISGNPTLLICGQVQGSNPSVRQVTLPFELGKETERLLMQGQSLSEAANPKLDQLLAEIRNILKQELGVWTEIPPLPWGHPYALALTHDIDILSLKELPVSRTFLGYFYRSSLVNLKRWRSGKVTTPQFIQALWEMVKTAGAKLGLGEDCWQTSLEQLKTIEQNLGVRSSLYFMPFAGKPGLGLGSDKAPENRAAYYDVAEHRDLLNALKEQGWEVGVHGIDAWNNPEAAASEYSRVSGLIGKQGIGVRMHWLYFTNPESFAYLDQGGFLYDSTFGYNEVIGFRAGTLQPYHPLNCSNLWELPLHVQDGALMAEEHGNMNPQDAYGQAVGVLDLARSLGGVVSLLWHNQSFTAPRFWGEVYSKLINDAKGDNAWIALPRHIVAWYAIRRKCSVTVQQTASDQWTVRCSALAEDPSLPALRVRLHISPERVKAASVPYEIGEDYIDILAKPVVYLEMKGDG